MESSAVPTRKVGAGGIAGSLAIVVIFIAGLFGLEIPGEVGAAIAAIIMFVVSYMTTEKENHEEL